MPIHVLGMNGLGDCIFQRAFIKALARRDGSVFVTTPWPELLDDIDGVRFVRPVTPLRTQGDNVSRQDAARWTRAPANAPPVQIRYGMAELKSGSIIEAMERRFGIAPESWDLPPFEGCTKPAFDDRPIALVRPVTVRSEWRNEARNCHPEYVAYVAGELMRDYRVISVAHLAHGLEWLVGDAPPAHERYHAGELNVRELLALVRRAAIVVGPVGWIVPAAIAARTPLFCILGGQGGHNHPLKITDPRMELSRAGFAAPDQFCTCENMRHGCDKRNSRLAEQWTRFRAQHGI